MRYVSNIFLFFFILKKISAGQYQEQQQSGKNTEQRQQNEDTKNYDGLTNLYNQLTGLSQQIVKNPDETEQAQNIQKASNLTQQFWDPNQHSWQNSPRYPYSAHMYPSYDPSYGWKNPPPHDPNYHPAQLPTPQDESDEGKHSNGNGKNSWDSYSNSDSNSKYNDDNDPNGNWKKKQDEWDSTSMKWAIGLGLGVGIPALLLIGICIFCLCRYIRRRRIHYIDGMYNSHSPILPMGAKNSNSYAGTWQVPPIAHDDTWTMDRDNVVVDYDKKLGAGAFCNVYQGRIMGDAPIKKIYHNLIAVNHFNNCDVAIKMLPSFADDIARSDFNQEINFMKSLNYHPHLVSMLGYVPDARSPLLIVEFCGQGDLLHLIREQKYEIANGYENTSGLKIKDLVAFSWQISNGLEYLNSAGCIHRDVAARNVLVDQRNVCKIGDFGLCRLTDNLLYTARGGRLPLRWMAPESLKSFEYSFNWSYGILLYELFSLGEVPYSTIENGHLLDYLESGERLPKPIYCPEEIYLVMQKCWQFFPADRILFRDACTIFSRILENATTEYGYVQPIPDEPTQQVDDV